MKNNDYARGYQDALQEVARKLGEEGIQQMVAYLRENMTDADAPDARPADADLYPLEVHCDTCGAKPAAECRTPSGKPTGAHQDRGANAMVISRHVRHATR